MTDLSGLWIGNIYGTNAGNAFLEIQDNQGELTGTLRFNDQAFGLTVFSLSGKIDPPSGKIDRIRIVPLQSPPGRILAPGYVTAELQADGALKGRWETDLGTGGVLLFSRDSAIKKAIIPTNKSGLTLEQMFFRTMPIGAIRMHAKDLEKLFQAMAQDFVQKQPIVEYPGRSGQVRKYANSFFQEEIKRPLKELKIFIQEPEPSGLIRSINIDFLDKGNSQIRTFGGDEAWVVGKAQTLQAILNNYEDKFANFCRRHVLKLNLLLLFIMVLFAPEFRRWQERSIFVISIWLAMLMVLQIYNRMVPNTEIYVSDRKIGWLIDWLRKSAPAWIFALMLKMGSWIWNQFNHNPN